MAYIIKMENNNKMVSVESIANEIKNGGKLGVCCCQAKQKIDSAAVELLIFESADMILFNNNGSFSSLTVQLTEKENHQVALIVGVAGEYLMPLSLHRNTNKNYAQCCADLLAEYGFTMIGEPRDSDFD